MRGASIDRRIRRSVVAKRVVVSQAAVREAARRSTRASYALEGRVVPDGFVRSAAAQRYLDELVQGRLRHQEEFAHRSSNLDTQ